MIRLKQIFIAVALIAAPCAGAVATAQTAPLAGGQLVDLVGADRTNALINASRALQAQTQLQGGFLQIGPDGSATKGKFYLKRPGKIRFEYEAPASLLVVANGSVVAIQDNRLKTFNRAPLRTTPLYFFLKDQINLAKDAKIVRVAKQAGTLAISIKDRSGQTDGVLTLLFTSESYELRQWIVEDGSGGVTRVALNNLQRPVSIDPKLFVLEPKKTPANR
jgi:outer membrane lipoprotein-sorting protein